jgi:hypothetical protein
MPNENAKEIITEIFVARNKPLTVQEISTDRLIPRKAEYAPYVLEIFLDQLVEVGYLEKNKPDAWGPNTYQLKRY